MSFSRFACRIGCLRVDIVHAIERLDHRAKVGWGDVGGFEKGEIIAIAAKVRGGSSGSQSRLDRRVFPDKNVCAHAHVIPPIAAGLTYIAET
jgi:hypothetical protein